MTDNDKVWLTPLKSYKRPSWFSKKNVSDVNFPIGWNSCGGRILKSNRSSRKPITLILNLAMPVSYWRTSVWSVSGLTVLNDLMLDMI